MARFNVFSAQTVVRVDSKAGFRVGVNRFGDEVGSTQIVGNLWDLPPGESMSNYHYEFPDEEWLIVLTGRPTLRTPDGEEELEPGDVAVFRPGPEGAHTVTNRTAEPVRAVMLSPTSPVGVTVYPDLDRINAMAGDQDAPLVLHREGPGLHYYEHES